MKRKAKGERRKAMESGMQMDRRRFTPHASRLTHATEGNAP